MFTFAWEIKFRQVISRPPLNRSQWLSQSSAETDLGSLESLDARAKRKLQLNSAVILGRKDMLLNLKRKLKKKNPKYLVSGIGWDSSLALRVRPWSLFFDKAVAFQVVLTDLSAVGTSWSSEKEMWYDPRRDMWSASQVSDRPHIFRTKEFPGKWWWAGTDRTK